MLSQDTFFGGALSDDDDDDDLKKLENFTASSNWIQRFKDRFSLTSRRHTTTKSLPENYVSTAKSFIMEVQDLIKEKKIQNQNIINFDQVPRYFESDSSSTITTKGTKQVLLRKGSTSHRRFTFTPFITAGGKFLGTHLLFSKLKKVPLVSSKVHADVNGTGMWSEEILKNSLKNIIVNRRESLFNSPTLVILDSYGVHVKFVKNYEETYERKNIFFKLIPPCLTGKYIKVLLIFPLIKF